MREEPDNLVLQLLRSMRAENSVRFDEIDAVLSDVRRVQKPEAGG
jgi:hypothetical protein